MIPLTRPSIDRAELRAVEDVMKTGMLVQGEKVAAFEASLASRVGRAHAVATASGTSALELALRAVGVKEGDEVLCPALTWPSPAHAIRLIGAQVVLVDVDPREWNAAPEAMRAAMTSKTRAAVVIDQFGNPARAPEIREALGDLPIIEDAACSLGSRFSDGPCGSLGLVSCFSFHPRKVITTGEGGMCVTDDARVADRLRVLRNHGQSAPGIFAEPAGNHRLTEMAGAMGLAQMEKLDAIIEGRRVRAAVYLDALPELSFQEAPDGALANYQTMGALLPEGSTAEARDAFIARLREGGVQAGLLSYALSRLPTVGARGAAPVSEDIVDRGLCLPLFPEMSEDEQAEVIRVVKGALR